MGVRSCVKVIIEANTRSSGRFIKVLTGKKKKVFFEKVPFLPTLCIHVSVTRAVVDTDFQTISKLLLEFCFSFQIILTKFHDREKCLCLITCLMSENQSSSGYATTINNVLQFHLVVKYPSHGLSFSQPAAVLRSTKQLPGIAQLIMFRNSDCKFRQNYGCSQY